MTAEEVLLSAAAAAERAPNVKRAVVAAWSALHADRDAMLPAFKAWNRHERGHDRDIPELGEVVRRRCSTPAAVAASLRAAAGVPEDPALVDAPAPEPRRLVEVPAQDAARPIEDAVVTGGRL